GHDGCPAVRAPPRGDQSPEALQGPRPVLDRGTPPGERGRPGHPGRDRRALRRAPQSPRDHEVEGDLHAAREHDRQMRGRGEHHRAHRAQARVGRGGMNLEAIATLLLWPLIGLVAWWARDRARQSGPLWLAIHLVVGPFMLVPIAWRFITAPPVAP